MQVLIEEYAKDFNTVWKQTHFLHATAQDAITNQFDIHGSVHRT
jgi:hypothetical protein